MPVFLLAQTTAPTATADDVLSPYVYVFYAAFVVAYLLTPMMRQVAMYYNIIDQPDMVRKLHRTPIAYLGGIAVFLGWLAGLAMSQFLNVHRTDAGLDHLKIPVAVVAAAVMMIMLGLWDDIRKAKPQLKIALQILAAIVLLWGGIGTHCTEPLLAPVFLRLNKYYGWNPQYDQLIGMITSAVATIFIVVGCCNATNLMDGLDGLCGGVTAIIAVGFVFLAVNMAMYGVSANANADGMRIVLGLALLGAVLGFLPYNFNPASIFLGDTGSMFIGFSCAVIMVMMAEDQPKWFLAAMVMFALPVMDTTLAFARRWVNRRPLFSADRHHFHHQLVARGYSVKQTAVISYAIAFGFVLLGAAIVYMRTRYAVGIYLVTFGSIIVTTYKIGMVHEVNRVASAQPIGADAAISAEMVMEPGSVLEVPDNENGKKIITPAPVATRASVRDEAVR
jgi:UDP-GlcNAc:undecaprenyl-phosphate/decaprenyl-phosphate GlcNAc-1-phosphate transferase